MVYAYCLMTNGIVISWNALIGEISESTCPCLEGITRGGLVVQDAGEDDGDEGDEEAETAGGEDDEVGWEL